MISVNASASGFQRGRALPSIRGGARWEFRSERVAYLPAAQDPEAGAIPTESTTAALRDAAHHG
jgi:hypothetical protein